MFAALGRFTVRFRWLIIASWIVATVVLVMCLPGLSTVEKSSNSQFLPSNAASVKAGELAAPFSSSTRSDVTYVASARGPLSPADHAAVERAEQAMRAVPKVTAVVDQGTSTNGRAQMALVELTLPSSTKNRVAAPVVSELRSTFTTSGAPPDLAMHLTGGLAESVDQQNSSGSTQTLIELLSVLFIVALLFFTFRALLAPLVALLPSAVALIASGPVIAESAHLGVQVSDLTPILLAVVLLGAGTDYGLFLIFRVREELRRGRSGDEAVSFSLCKVGESITFSGLTVIGALSTVVIATFGLYQGLGPALAIGIAVALLANLTLLPALLAVLGGAVFWPRIPQVGEHKGGTWGRIAGKVVNRPVLTLVVGLVIFGGLALSMLAYAPTGFGDQPAPATSDSGRGQAVLAADFPSDQDNPTTVLFRLPTSVWDEPQVLAQAQRGLMRSGLLSDVNGALNANGTAVTPTALAQAHAQLDGLGPAAELPVSSPVGTDVTPATYRAYQGSAQFISADGRTILYEVDLRAGPSTSTAAADAIPAVRLAVADVARSIGADADGVNGYAAQAADVGSISGGDLVSIIPIVMIVLALLLAIVLRSLVAPIYLVISVGLSYLASLGLAVLVFVLIGGQDGINFVLPFFMFIFIMALGQDYNILVMTRIREEAHHAPIRVAVRRAVEATGTTVTSAGLILAGTFGVLTATGDTQVQEIGLGLAAGILLDTFFVRTLLVPSVVVLLGRWNWWPSKLAFEDHSHDPVLPDHGPRPRGTDPTDAALEPERPLVGAGQHAPD
ncbi:MAG TPA: MMPL family transporter [Acidimicrobiales bacterium]|nr:MMPL family transporter [Acidimicrobiales bacterium]